MPASSFARHVVVTTPGRVSPRAVAVIRRLLAPLVRLCFRPTLEGTEHLPEDGPYLLVANHSAGVGAAELTSIATLWLNHFGTSKPLAGFALPVGFVVWPLSAIHREIGTIPSTYAAAHTALAQGVPVLVFPGGDHESLKPIWENHRVDFCGRVGFLRIARDAGVPIVPLGIRNGSWTAPILLRSRLLSILLVLPHLLGVKRWGLSLLGLIVATALALTLPFGPLGTALAIWIWLGSPLIFLPIVPATLRLRIGAPIPPAELFPTDRSTHTEGTGDTSSTDTAGDETLASARERVERTLEALIRG
ncbi:MAG: hypothetical protein EA398_16430 [Deltaproteobacteria bacterium]|nr:MAG: hypothetical protein EA398_16430 [Deltaproteobacteria bacterium]